jgi:hypothetical protein
VLWPSSSWTAFSGKPRITTNLGEQR